MILSYLEQFKVVSLLLLLNTLCFDFFNYKFIINKIDLFFAFSSIVYFLSSNERRVFVRGQFTHTNAKPAKQNR